MIAALLLPLVAWLAVWLFLTAVGALRMQRGVNRCLGDLATAEAAHVGGHELVYDLARGRWRPRRRGR